MNDYRLDERIDLYVSAGMEQKFPVSKPHLGADGRLQAVWFGGQDYSGTGYCGSFPPNYLKRIDALFPDAKKRIHLFSGSLEPSKRYIRLDCKQPAEISADAENLSTLKWCWAHAKSALHCASACEGLCSSPHPDCSSFKPICADWIHADPPYTDEDAAKYGVALVNRNKVVAECAKVVELGGFLCWFDMVLPMYRAAEWDIVGVIGIIRSTNHRFRCTTIFQRK